MRKAVVVRHQDCDVHWSIFSATRQRPARVSCDRIEHGRGPKKKTRIAAIIEQQSDSLSHAQRNAWHTRKICTMTFQKIPEKVVGPRSNGDDSRPLLWFGTEHLRHLMIAQIPASAATNPYIGEVHFLLLAEYAFVVQPIHITVRDGHRAFTGGDAVAHTDVVAVLWKVDLCDGERWGQDEREERQRKAEPRSLSDITEMTIFEGCLNPSSCDDR